MDRAVARNERMRKCVVDVREETRGEVKVACTSVQVSLSAHCPSKQTPWPESASELYRPSDCSLSAK
jgi:hypothetical protein